MVKIDDTDIEFAEQILSMYQHGEQIMFDDERKVAISEMESCDVQACPGSGKTTVLHAKLLALSRKYPFPNNRYVCILTHTNVAIDEIRRKLTTHGGQILDYPNFCGTIQQFTNRFLAIPSYIKKFGRRPYCIDDEEYNIRVEKKLSGYPVLNTFLKNKHTDRYISHAQSYRFSLRDFSISDSIINTGTARINLATKSGKQLVKLKSSLLEDGYLCYDDAYSLAFQYLRDTPLIIDVLRSRFQYVLIDEMQDSSSFQQQLIDDIFLSFQCTIQRYGDKNQTIYHKGYEQERETIWGGSAKKLTINSSKRFSSIIGKVSRNVCTDPHTELIGNPKVPEINPVIILYDHSRIKDVIPEFAKLVYQNNLVSSDSVIKAVGSVKKAKNTPERYSILDYVAEEIQEATPATNVQGMTLPQFRKEVLGMIQTSLRKCEVRYSPFPGKTYYYSASKLESLLKEQHPIKYYELMQLVTELYKLMPMVGEIKEPLISHLSHEILPIFSAHINDATSEYLKDLIIPIYRISEAEKTVKFITVDIAGTKIGIELSTIHSVKGETHTATLFLETFNNDYDITKLLPFLQGSNENRSMSRISGFLRQGYVAMTRPSHFLCLAVHRKHTTTKKTTYEIANADIEQLENQGWKVHKLLDNPKA